MRAHSLRPSTTTQGTSLNVWQNNIGTDGARSLATALDNNVTLTTLNLERNHIRRSLAASLDKNANLKPAPLQQRHRC
jgi:hypothetical protein